LPGILNRGWPKKAMLRDNPFQHEMKLIILGSGTAIPLADRASPCLALTVEGSLLLLDMGPGSLRQMTTAGLDHKKIERIFITHFHPDHTADLIHFLFATKNPSILEKRSPFTVTGPAGLRGLMEAIQEVYHPWLDLPPELMKVEELNSGARIERDYGNFRLSARKTEHTPQSLAYRLESRQGKSLVYSGDTGLCKGIMEIAREADLLVLECSFPDGQGVEGHLTPSEAGLIAREARARRLLLTHFYPECLRTDIMAQCRKAYRGEIILGRDFLEVTV